MKIKILFLLSLCSTLLAFGQTAKINQIDQQGKKDGKWIVYVNDKGKVTKDSSRAVYYLYTYYDHGTNIYPMGTLWGRGDKIESITGSKQNEKIKVVDGEYKLSRKNGKIKFIWVFKNGEFISYKNFYPTGKLHEYLDYTKQWMGQPHTYCVYIYDKNGEAKYYYMRKAKDGWMAYGSVSDSSAIENTKVIGDSTFATARFYANGKLIRQTDRIFVRTPKEQEAGEGMAHGSYTTWYTNGQKQMEGQYYYGKKNGEWKHWDKDGKAIKENDSSR